LAGRYDPGMNATWRRSHKLATAALMATIVVVLQSSCMKKKTDDVVVQSPDWESLLKDGSAFTNELGQFTLRLTNVVDLTIASGKVVACDGLVFETEALAGKFPAGKFPIMLAVAHFSDDQRVACAVVRFNQAKTVRWKSCGGYGVDSGTGCYMDAKAAAILEKRFLKEPDFPTKVIAELEKHQINTWSWANITLDEATGLNCVLFSSGVGDGGYNCFVGYDEGGTPTMLVTDFGLLSP
jgi:hypothetical protein